MEGFRREESYESLSSRLTKDRQISRGLGTKARDTEKVEPEREKQYTIRGKNLRNA